MQTHDVLEELRSVDDIVDALGGRDEANRLLAVGRSAISNWKSRGIPAARYRLINALLAERGKRAADALFFREEPVPL